jgi:tetratricopeptide (TPR) repeat protein
VTAKFKATEFYRISTMPDTLHSLSQAELLALALEASRLDDSGHALAYLKEASNRDDASPRALFMLGSEYAQLGLMDDAKASMARAAQADPEFAIAHFQLGMLHVTSGQVDAAKAAWAPLAMLGTDHPQAYLANFHKGMLYLVADQFDDAIAALNAGLAQNQENEALNNDMRRVIDAINHLPGRSPETARVQAPAESTQSAAAATPAVDGDIEPSHLFINAYTHRGKPH